MLSAFLSLVLLVVAHHIPLQGFIVFDVNDHWFCTWCKMKRLQSHRYEAQIAGERDEQHPDAQEKKIANNIRARCYIS
jgi:hypothetical protein